MIRPDTSWPDESRLHVITTELSAELARHQPDRVCIEDVFVARNPSSALKLGMARGAALVAVAGYGCSVVSISARRVKQNITGTGRGDKAQVAAMVSRLLGITPAGADSADALAIAMAGVNDEVCYEDDSTASSNLQAAIARALMKEQTP